MANTTIQDVANILTRPSENDISITASHKGIQLKKRYLRPPYNTPAKRARALAIVASVKTRLDKESVEGFLITLAIELDKEKRLTIANTTILNNYFEVRRADIKVLKKISTSLNT